MLVIFLICWLPSAAITLLLDLKMLDHISNTTREFLTYSSYFDDVFYGIISFLFWFFIPNLRFALLKTIKTLFRRCRGLTEEEESALLLEDNTKERKADISDLNMIFRRNLLACSAYGISHYAKDELHSKKIVHNVNGMFFFLQLFCRRRRLV
jgi:hypothetical protein